MVVTHVTWTLLSVPTFRRQDRGINYTTNVLEESKAQRKTCAGFREERAHELASASADGRVDG